MTRKEALKLRKKIVELAQAITDEEILDYPNLCDTFKENTEYKTGDRVRYAGNLYKCLQDHTSQATWTPEAAPSLWAKIINEDPSGDIPEWEQPGSTNPYMKGDKVKHNGKIWESEIDNNVWEPGVYGWQEVTE